MTNSFHRDQAMNDFKNGFLIIAQSLHCSEASKQMSFYFSSPGSYIPSNGLYTILFIAFAFV